MPTGKALRLSGRGASTCRLCEATGAARRSKVCPIRSDITTSKAPSSASLARKRDVVEGLLHLVPLFLRTACVDEGGPHAFEVQIQVQAGHPLGVLAQLHDDVEGLVELESERLDGVRPGLDEAGCELLVGVVAHLAQQAELLGPLQQRSGGGRVVDVEPADEVLDGRDLPLGGAEHAAHRACEPQELAVRQRTLVEHPGEAVELEPLALQLLDQLDPGHVPLVVVAGPATHFRRWKQAAGLVGAQ